MAIHQHLSGSLAWHWVYGQNDRGPPFLVVTAGTVYLTVPRIKPTSSVFIDKCATHQATVAMSNLYNLSEICQFNM